ncbi:hypothetical protein NBRC111894_431 [Sporolactobacillus inulinus]|jgi:hypothetical protein|uniref:Uncharacterized protein n=2 Tax=Sporolactobacillus inulinus TaxID=2078 RepID=A0A4Y1Z744_9BACL|nr:hypothetical protein SINU_06940 [Sporolactobacillus inulinus CASD]GAY74877.1 hypothetical protein NBRC111894_431 [Sporolactobacillus inulinus]
MTEAEKGAASVFFAGKESMGFLVVQKTVHQKRRCSGACETASGWSVVRAHGDESKPNGGGVT